MEFQEYPCFDTLCSKLDARQQTIPKAFGFEAATRRGFFEEFFLAI